jgi:hypothetical protein
VATVTVDLQDGFEGDAVEVFVDGERRWREEGVTTNIAVSLAASVPLDVPDGPANVRVAVPARGLEAVLAVQAAGEVHLAANLAEGQLRLEQLAERPYYL